MKATIKPSNEPSTLKLPPGPKTPPLIQMLHYLANPINFMDSTADHYGDIFTTRIGWNFQPLVFVSNPQALQEIFTDPKYEAPGSGERIFQPFLGELSISRTLDMPRYRRKRKLMMPAFHGEKIAAHGHLINKITEQVMEKYNSGKSFVLKDAMTQISQNVILEGIIGIREGERSQSFKQLLSSWLKTLSSPLSTSLLYVPFLQKDLGPWSSWGRLSRLNQKLNQLLEDEIKERRQQNDPSRTDVLTMLMKSHDENGIYLSDEELRDDMLTLLAAGQESTSSAMTLAMYWIHHLPEVKLKLLEELASLGDSPDPLAIVKLPYLNNVCQEILRLHPVAPTCFPRLVKSPVELMGYKLNPGTEVVPIIYLTHQRDDLYPDPKKFKPERFLERKFSPYEYLPFGGGSHVCIGGALAMFEMKVVLGTILSRYQMQLMSSRPLQIQVGRITLEAVNGVPMMITGRR
jgi:cytochrome P450 family 110